MAVVPVCLKLCYKDQTVNKGCNQDIFKSISPIPNDKVKTECVFYKSMVMKSNTRCASRLRCLSVNASEREKQSRENQLRSLDSYFGKSKNDAIHRSPTSSKNDRDLHNSSMMNEEKGLISSADYLGPKSNDLVSSAATNKETITTTATATPHSFKGGHGSRLEVDAQRGSNSEYDETSGLHLISTLASINIAVYLFEIASPIRNSDLELFSIPSLYGAKINHLILYGEWWRLLTPMFLHTGIFHIGFGCWVLLTFGPRVCRAYGPFTFIFIYILGGVSGNLTSFLHTPDPTVGGTGPVFAIIGAWLIYQYQNKDAIAKDVFESMYHKAIVATAFGFVLSTFGPIDDWTHFGSAFTGIAYGFVTCPTLQMDDSSSETGQEDGIALVRRNVDPCKSLLFFSIFILVLTSSLFFFEPPLNSLVVEKLG